MSSLWWKSEEKGFSEIGQKKIQVPDLWKIFFPPKTPPRSF
jgi:hypothetical protein